MRLNSVLNVHFVDRRGTYVTPMLIFVAIILFVVAVTALVTASSGSPAAAAPEMYEAQVWNGAIFAFVGMGIGVGIATMTQYLNFALGFGLTRREYLVGSAIVFALVSAGIAIVTTIFKLIEVATSGFWVGARIFNTVWTGTGDWWQTLIQVFLITIMFMVVSATIASVWNRWGNTGILILSGLGLLLVTVAGVLVLSGNAALMTWIASLASLPWIAGMAVMAVVTVVCGAAWMVLGRTTQVR